MQHTTDMFQLPSCRGHPSRGPNKPIGMRFKPSQRRQTGPCFWPAATSIAEDRGRKQHSCQKCKCILTWWEPASMEKSVG